MPKFTKQHYEAVAKILAKHVGIERRNPRDDTLNLLVELVDDFRCLFAAGSESFDSRRFIRACWHKG